MHIGELIEIGFLSLMIFFIIRNLKGTRIWIIVKGIAILFTFYMISYLCSFKVITYIFNNLIGVLSTALIIMFQPELRRLFETLGKKNITHITWKRDKDPKRFSNKTREALVTSTRHMSKAKTGALIVLQKDVPLKEYSDSGIQINAESSSQLIENIFEHNTPLHDGAVIINGDTIEAATCYLPLSQNTEINKSLGTRHRAGIGLSENTDAFVIIVSEETGAISVAKGGVLYHNIDSDTLDAMLKDAQKITQEIKLKTTIRRKTLAYGVLSVFIGIVTWSIIIQASDPVITKTFTLPVSTVNESILTDLGKSYIVETGDKATIQVQGKRSVMLDVRADDFSAEANFSKLSITNAVPIEIKTDLKDSDVSVEIKDGNTMVLQLEDMADVECSIQVQKEGTDPNGCYYTNFKPSIDKIKITGPKSKIKTVDKTIAIYKVGEDVELKQNATLNVYDKNGNIMDLSDCTLSEDEIEVVGECLRTKTVPIEITADEYKISDLSVSASEIEIAAEERILNDIDIFHVNIDTSKLESNKINSIIKLKEYAPENVVLLKDVELEVSGEINKYETTEISFGEKDVKIFGDKKVSFKSKKLKVSVTHTTDDNIKIADLFPYIDVSELENGTYTLQIQFKNNNNYKIENIPSVSVAIE